MNNETRKNVGIELNIILDQYDSILIKDHIKLHAELLAYIKSLLQNEQEGEEVSVYDEFKGVKYGTCNGRSKTKCGSDQKEGTEVCEICGTKLIWPDNEKKVEA